MDMTKENTESVQPIWDGSSLESIGSKVAIRAIRRTKELYGNSQLYSQTASMALCH